MALDEALAESVRAGGPPVLRFYSWDPFTLSLGRFQNPAAGLGPGAAGVPRVRRLTGGGALWHGEELTYSLACTQEDLGPLTVKASFERLCGFLLDTWRSFGWDAAFARDALPGASGLGTYTPACFAGKEEYDILVGGKKLGGNAQRRDRKHLFQHGSLPLVLDLGALDDLFLPGSRPGAGTVTDLRSCGWTGPASGLIGPLVRAFEARLGTSAEEDRLSEDERLRAGALAEERYGNPSWTETAGGSVRGP